MEFNNPTLTVKEGYGLDSEAYDKNIEKNPLIKIEEPVVLEMINNVEGKKVLDLGCGTGRYSIKFAKEGAEVTGIDLSEDMLGIAREKVTNKMKINFLKGDMSRKIDLPDKSFDLIISSLAMSHLEEIDGFIENIGRLLNNDGISIISTHHPYLIKIAKVRTLIKSSEGYNYIETYSHLFNEILPLLSKNNLCIEKIKEPCWNMSYPDLGDIREIPGALVLKLKCK